ncbi:isoprenoid synthase domain-containing protein [Lophiotrema nucula]|uniref:Terpene synthase n=1 Tax=Lophiotrema nucula TaxID=690887 RepID=A0A6A5Z6Q6_9PLEO|nr:isoprenoid synthase domain-containing protein [Lophiotrema nucula]
MASTASGTVTIPDLFESFLSQRPTINPHYVQVQEECMDWVSEMCGHTPEEKLRFRKAELGYYTAIAYPYADPAKLRTVTDNVVWAVMFDDGHDDGLFGDEKGKAAKYIDSVISVLGDQEVRPEDIDRTKEPCRYILATIRQRMKDNANITEGACQRFLKREKAYLESLPDATNFQPSATLEESIKRYLPLRLLNASVLPMFSLLEYCYDLQIPDHVFEHPAFIEIERVGVEMQMLANDIYSCHRERERDSGFPCNIIHLYMHHGLSEQAAYDETHAYIRNLYKRWYLALADLPIFGEKVDKDIHTYITGIKDITLANLVWSFYTERYFGKDAETVRKTRVLKVDRSKEDWLQGIPVMGEIEALMKGKSSES